MRNTRRRRLIFASLIVHLGVVFALFITAFWRLERLPIERHSSAIAQLESQPAAASSPRATAPHITFTKKPARVVVRTIVRIIVQPVIEPDVTPVAATTTGTGDGSGSGSGRGSGSGSGSGSGPCDDDCGKTPPVVDHHEDARIIPPTMLTGLRVSGDPQIHPPELVKSQMLHEGHDRVMGVYKVCISTSGDIASVKQAKSTGYPEYDQRLLSGVQTWRYHPYEVNGHVVPVCSVVTFVYTIK